MEKETTVALLLITGAVLIFAEIFLPGMIAGAIGAVSLLAGVIAAYVYLGSAIGNLVAVGTLAASAFGAMLWFKYFPQSAIARKFTLNQPAPPETDGPQGLLGQKGKTLTALRPAGQILVNGRRMDVVSDGAFVDAGQLVEVIEVDGLRIVVRPV